jgi:hypothetical protein
MTDDGVTQDGNTALYWLEKSLKNSEDLTEYQTNFGLSLVKTLRIEGYSSSRAKP